MLFKKPENTNCLFFQFARVNNGDWFRRFAAARANSFDRFDDVHAFEHLAEHNVFAVEPARHHCGDEELRTIGVATGVGHRQQSRFRVLQFEVFVGKFLAIDRFAASTVTTSEITL